MCGIDGSPEARESAQMAAALTTRLGLRLVLAHVIDAARPHDSYAVKQQLDGWEKALVEVADGLPRPDLIELRVEFGDRAEVLAQLAAEEGADLIVLGSKPRRLRDRWLSCPLARELEAITPVPILISPPQTRRRSARRLAVSPAAGG